MNHACIPGHEMLNGLPCVVVGFIVLAIVFTITAVLALTAIVWCMIFHKAGYHWALGLLRLVPFARLIVLLVLAFSEWPIQKELKSLREQVKKMQPPAA